MGIKKTIFMFLLIGCNLAQAEYSCNYSKEKEVHINKLDNIQTFNLLNKVGFGATEKTISEIDKGGFNTWFNQQLNCPNFYNDKFIESKNKELKIEKENLFDVYKKNDWFLSKGKVQLDELEDGILVENFIKRTNYALYSENRLRESMVWFWFNHFNIGAYTSHNAIIFLNDYEKSIRKNALGNFKVLLGEIAHHPAMLYYLNNVNNKKPLENIPNVYYNENYARELLELHTLGVDNGYTQNDVMAVTKILTGFEMFSFEEFNKDGAEKIQNKSELKEFIDKLKEKNKINYVLGKNLFLYNEFFHDFSDKKFLNYEIKGEGYNELDKLLDIIAIHPSTAKFISKKLALYFLSDTPSEEIINKMADTFIKSKGEISLTLKELFESKEFIESLDKKSKFKNSYEFTISTLKALNEKNIKNNEIKKVHTFLKEMESELYTKPTPDGYSLIGEDWKSADRLKKHIYFSKLVSNKEITNYDINKVKKFYKARLNKEVNDKDDLFMFYSSYEMLNK